MKKILNLKCPNCKASLEFKEKRDVMFCEYCGAKLLLDNENEYVYRLIDEADVKRAETEQSVKLKEMELKEKERENNQKILKLKIIFSVILGVAGLLFLILVFALGEKTGDSDSAWYMLSFGGMVMFLILEFIWANGKDH